MSARDELANLVYLSGYAPDSSSAYPIQPLAERANWEIASCYRAADSIIAAGFRKAEPKSSHKMFDIDNFDNTASGWTPLSYACSTCDGGGCGDCV